jgi:DNA-binding CsgD family transcriptional regulator
MRCEVSRRLALSYLNRGLTAEALEVLAPLGSDNSMPVDDRLEIQAMSAAIVASSGTRERADLLELIERLEKSIALVAPPAQVRVLQRLASAAFYAGSLETAERLGLDAASLAGDLRMDTASALAYGTLYAVAGLVDVDTRRARTYLRSQAAAAERAGNSSLYIYAMRAEYSFAAISGDVAEANAIESQLADQTDARTYRDGFTFRRARALLYVTLGEIGKAESTMRAMTTKTLSSAERAHRDAFISVLLLAQGNRVAAAASVERGLVVDATHDFWSRTETARAYMFRGLAFWALDRPAQARKAFEFEKDGLPRRDQVLMDVMQRLCDQPHPLPNTDAFAPLAEALIAAGYASYAALLRAVVERDANDVQLSAAEIETLREFDRFGGRAADVAKALGKSKYTVQNQVQSAIRKLGCSGRAEALAYARRRGWLDHG